jgi:hypothetical protein
MTACTDPKNVRAAFGLKAGKHAITVTYFDHAGEGDLLSVSYAGPGISKRAIPAAALFRTTGTAPPPFTATLEAENAVRSGAVVSTLHCGLHRHGFVDYLNPTGDYVEWTANVPTAGAYALSFRYALQSAQARQLAIRVNGTLVNSGLTFPPTISLTSWTYVSLTANLQAGANTIRATGHGYERPQPRPPAGQRRIGGPRSGCLAG